MMVSSGRVRVAEAQAFGPAAGVTRRAADRLQAGHLWVYRSDVEVFIPAMGTTGVEAGSLVTVMDARGMGLGTAIYSNASEIALRMVSGRPGVTRAEYLVELRERVVAAVRLRRELAGMEARGGLSLDSERTNAVRLIFSEADGLPGIVVDRYSNVVVVQLLTQGTAQDDVRAVLIAALVEGLGVEAQGAQESTAEEPGGGFSIWERPDARIRELERLGVPPAGALYVAASEMAHGAAAKTTFAINGLRFAFDAAAGQKTGAFLDQRLNYAAAARYGRGEALDICTYQGGFALHLARTCERVTGVDASRAALEVADQNRESNAGLLQAEVDWIEADAFELLREFEGSGRQYDTIVLDPPAFAKSKRAAEGAMRGYKEMNLRAMKMLRGAGASGILVTCSCSHHVSLQDFTAVVAAAASDAGRRVQVLEMRGAAPDHPAVLTLPETSYLKCLICRVG